MGCLNSSHNCHFSKCDLHHKWVNKKALYFARIYRIPYISAGDFVFLWPWEFWMLLVSADENLFEAAAVCHIMCFGESRIQWMFRRRPCAGVMLGDDDETCTILQKECGLLGQSCRCCKLWLSVRFSIFKCQNPILATQQKCRFFFTQNLALCMNKKLTGRLVEIFEFQMGIHILSKLKSTTTLSMTCLRFQSCNVECEVFIISYLVYWMCGWFWYCD